jgi:hypothetical protein
VTTPGLDADALLAGPRGRRLCLELAEEFDAEVRRTAFFAARSTSDGVLRQNLVDALARTGAHAIDSWTDPLKFAEAVDHTVSSAMYWQPPDNWDVVLADAEVTETLRRIAEAVVAAPAAAWWSTPVELSALRYTDRHSTPPLAPQLAGAAERLRRWHERIVVDNRNAAANRPADPAASLTGSWWSTPTHAHRLTTTRPLPGIGSLTLLWEEDSVGADDATVWPLATSREPKVWEIDGPDAWTRLVAAYPLDVTHVRKHDWYRVTGRSGRWLIPDWSAVAADWDAVHVSVAGYLSTATRSLPLPDGDTAATLLAGWDPDQTWWLTDVLRHAGPSEHWTRVDDEWQRDG